MQNNALITCSTDVCESETLVMFYNVNGEKTLCCCIVVRVSLYYFFCCLYTKDTIVNNCLFSDDVGRKNHSCYDISTAWHSKMVPGHIHRNGI